MNDLLSTIYTKKISKSRIRFRKEVSVTEEKVEYTVNNHLLDSINKELDKEVVKFLSGNIDLKNYKNILLTTDTKAYAEKLDFDNIRAIVNTKKINSIYDINEHFRAVNSLLPDAGIYIGTAETYTGRKERITGSFGKITAEIIWFFDFIINRVLPKTISFGWFFNLLLKKENHVISLAEILGRLVYCGFEIIDYKSINGVIYYITMKTRQPSKNPPPSFHPLIRLQRVGKNKKPIGVFKLRTMHPYSEYLQDFVIKLNGYNAYGKPANDFRVSRWGKFFRKYWLDEIPQLLNLIKGELTIVGVRPLSQARYKELPEYIQNARTKYKPGLIPPYVSLNMPDNKGNIEAERIYIEKKEKHPFLTDLRFFLMAVYNILTGKIVSS